MKRGVTVMHSIHTQLHQSNGALPLERTTVVIVRMPREISMNDCLGAEDCFKTFGLKPEKTFFSKSKERI